MRPHQTLGQWSDRPSPSELKPEVLIVEDDHASSQALRLLLSRMNCQVQVVSLVRDALAHLVTQTPEYVILDLMLPDGDGAEILRQLRQTNSQIKVIVTTAMSDPDRLRETQELAPYRFVRKPFDVVDLLKAMNMM